MIKKYRKKPVVVEAVLWDGLNTSEIKKFCGNKVEIIYYDAAWKAGKGPIVATPFIDTPEGLMQANKGDYIIRGIHNEFYPCKPDIFMKTYEEVVDG